MSIARSIARSIEQVLCPECRKAYFYGGEKNPKCLR